MPTTRAGTGRQLRDGDGEGLGVAFGRVVVTRPPVGVAVAGEIDKRRAAGRGPSATVSQVWAFCEPPCTSTSSGSPVPPHQRAHLLAGADGNADAPHDGWMGEDEAGIGGVVAGRGRTRRSSRRSPYERGGGRRQPAGASPPAAGPHPTICEPSAGAVRNDRHDPPRHLPAPPPARPRLFPRPPRRALPRRLRHPAKEMTGAGTRTSG